MVAPRGQDDSLANILLYKLKIKVEKDGKNKVYS